MNRRLLRGIKSLRGNRLVLHFISVRKSGVSQEPDVSVLNGFSPFPGTSAILTQERKRKKGEIRFHLAVIVPVFNVEAYIRPCIESLLNQQTSYQYQIIIINDGTQDKSIDNIQDLLSDPRILLVHQSNTGFSGARNRGLDLADAAYIGFVDSDDYVKPDMVETMLKAAYQYQADIVAGSCLYYHEKYGKYRKVCVPCGRIANGYDISGMAWGKLFRRELFQEIQFPLNYWFEDAIMKHLIYPKAQSIYGIPDLVYVYRIRAGSISNRYYGVPKCLDSTWITYQMLEDRKKLGLSNDEPYLYCFLKQLALNYQREGGVQEEIRRQVFYWMAKLTHTEFPLSSGKGLSGGVKKLYQALMYYDYQAYCRLCLWL